MRWWLTALSLTVICSGCSRGPSTPAAAAAAPAQPKLGIRPAGDTEIQPDLGKIQSEDLKKIFAYIDQHIDDHVVNLQKWIRQPSISNSGEGIPESAEMVKGIVEQAPFKKVLIGRGATNSKGPEMAQLNALMAIKAVTGKLPVNIVFVAEGDEERMDVGVRKFVKDLPEFFKNVDALIGEAGTQAPSGGAGVGGGSEGC